MNKAAIRFALVAALLATSCGDDDDAGPVTTDDADGTTAEVAGRTITLVTYDSFPERDDDQSPVNAALDQFTEHTGIEVEVLHAGDAGTMVSKASLTAGNPEGDVMFGVDNTFLSRVVDEKVFDSYAAKGLESLPADLRALTPAGEATPVDYGDVCVNYDIGWYEERGLEPPSNLADLADERYADQLVVENPATSSPGLAFLLATIAEYGDDGWRGYWEQLRANGVAVVDDWEQAYNEEFSWVGGGSRPLVVSYGSSPPAEVIYADPRRDDAPTGVIESTCFRQIEYAGVLRGTDEPAAARALIDFLVSAPFQETLALNLFVYPVNPAVELPPEFVEFTVVPDDPASLDPATIGEHRAEWTDEWTETVLR
jgi:thiamine transport system substrate-binding protein